MCSKCIKLTLLIIYLLIVVIFSVLLTFSSTFKLKILSLFPTLSHPSALEIIGLAFLLVLLKTIGFPITLFELFVAYIVKSFWTAFFISFIGKVIGTIVIFFIARLAFKEKVEEFLKDNEIYQIIKKMVIRSQWKVAFMVYFMFIPSFVKHYGLAITEIGFIQYFSPSAIISVIYSFLWTSIGHKMSSINDLVNQSKVEEKMEQNEEFKIIHIFFIAGNVIALLALMYYAYSTYQEEKDKQRNEELLGSSIEFTPNYGIQEENN